MFNLRVVYRYDLGVELSVGSILFGVCFLVLSGLRSGELCIAGRVLIVSVV